MENRELHTSPRNGFDKLLFRYPIDIQKSRWRILFAGGFWSLLGRLIGTVLLFSALTLIPLILAWVFQTQSFVNLAWFLGLFLAVYLFLLWQTKYFIAYQMRLTFNIECFISELLMKTDPQYHVTKSNGYVLSKFNRFRTSLPDLVDMMDTDIVPFITKNVSAVAILFGIQPMIGIVALFLLVFVTYLNTHLRIISSKHHNPKRIKAQDEASELVVESMYNTIYIRSVFGTPEFLDRIYRKFKNSGFRAASQWRSNNFVVFAIRMALVVQWGIICLFLLNEIKANRLSPAVALSAAIAYTGGTSDIIAIGKRIQKLFDLSSEISNSWKFFQNIPKPTFEV